MLGFRVLELRDNKDYTDYTRVLGLRDNKDCIRVLVYSHHRYYRVGGPPEAFPTQLLKVSHHHDHHILSV